MSCVQPAEVAPAVDDVESPHRPDFASPASRTLRAVVLLAGSVGSQSLASAAGRSAARLPVDQTSTILCHWRHRLELFARQMQIDSLPLRVIESRAQGDHVPATPSNVVRISIEHDRTDLRGPGGVARDAVDRYHDDARVLVASAGQLVTGDLADFLHQLIDTSADVAVITFEDGTSADMMLMRCGCLRELPVAGFVDLKEQGLSLIARRHRVQVVAMRRRIFMPVRTRAGYIQALRRYHQDPHADAAPNPLEEDWKPAFSVCEPGARVDPAAKLHDSVALAGAVVEAGAVLVRSVACPGGVVRRNQLVAESVVCGPTPR